MLDSKNKKTEYARRLYENHIAKLNQDVGNPVNDKFISEVTDLFKQWGFKYKIYGKVKAK